jgi:hypothetical protein
MEADVTVDAVRYKESLTLPKGTAEKMNVKARLQIPVKWSEVDISCTKTEKDEKKQPPGESGPEKDEKKEEKNTPGQAGKIVTLDAVKVICDFDVLVDRNIFPLEGKDSKVYVYTTADGKGGTNYEFSLKKPTEDAPEEFNKEDMQKHVETHADKVAEILAAYLRGIAIQKEFCGEDEIKKIPEWKKQQEKDLQMKIFKELSDKALAAAGGSSEEQKIRKAQYDSLHSGKGHGK